jgi:hypothetical protein
MKYLVFLTFLAIKFFQTPVGAPVGVWLLLVVPKENRSAMTGPADLKVRRDSVGVFSSFSSIQLSISPIQDPAPIGHPTEDS